jgi:hypothetical protein
MGGSLRTDDGKPATSVFLRRITMFDRLSDKQCFQLLVFIVGMLAVPVLLGSWAIAEWFFGEELLGLISLSFLGYMAYRVFQEINPDND